jgi:hypothetical protein
MFEKIEDQPRNPNGTLRNPWLEVGFTALYTAILRMSTAYAQQQVFAHTEGIWANWYSQIDPLRPIVKAKMDEAIERRIAGAFEDAEPEDVTKPQIIADIDAAKRIVTQRWKRM